MTNTQPRKRTHAISHDSQETERTEGFSSKGPRSTSRWPAALLLCTGTSLTTVSQFLSNAGLAEPSAQLVSWIKYFSTLVANVYQAKKGTAKPLTRKVKLLLATVGLLDVIAYTLFVAGFAVLGSALSTTLFAACGQIFTALFTVICLKRSLSSGQILAVFVVGLGLVLRGMSNEMLAQMRDGELWTGSVHASVDRQQVVGVCCTVGSALGYSMLGVAYDAILQEPDPPPHATIMTLVSILGFVATSGYQVFYTLPRWNELVVQPMKKKGTSLGTAVLLMTLFGAVFNVHAYVQSLVFQRESAVGVGLVNAMRGATVSLVSASIFCTPATPWQCLTAWSGASAAVVTVGVVMWVLCKQPEGKIKAKTDKKDTKTE